MKMDRSEEWLKITNFKRNNNTGYNKVLRHTRSQDLV